MNILQKIEHFKSVWSLVLPHINTPTDEDAIRWTNYPVEDVEAAILRVGKKFAKGKSYPDFKPEDAYRYVTSTARSTAEQEGHIPWRQIQ